jgi:hypothetical protein
MSYADKILFAGVLVVGAGLILLAGALPASADASTAVIVAPHGRTPIDLARDGRHEVSGLLGPVTVEVRGGAARVVESPCPDRRCMAMEPVSAFGQAIVCAPSGVTVAFEPVSGQELDDVVR